MERIVCDAIVSSGKMAEKAPDSYLFWITHEFLQGWSTSENATYLIAIERTESESLARW